MSHTTHISILRGIKQNYANPIRLFLSVIRYLSLQIIYSLSYTWTYMRAHTHTHTHICFPVFKQKYHRTETCQTIEGPIISKLIVHHPRSLIIGQFVQYKFLKILQPAISQK